jgi:hypothetical protein
MRIRYDIGFAIIAMAIVYMAAKIFRLIYLNIGVEKNLCPNCGAIYINKSSPRWYLDWPYRMFGLRPFRCTICETRFFAFREPSEIAARHEGRAVRVNHAPAPVSKVARRL